MQKNLSLTLSIGIGAGSQSLVALGQLAQSSLDLVLGRGGDQVAIKQAEYLRDMYLRGDWRHGN